MTDVQDDVLEIDELSGDDQARGMRRWTARCSARPRSRPTLPSTPASSHLTGDRPTGRPASTTSASLSNRVRLQNLGANTMLVVADYQVIYDRDGARAAAGQCAVRHGRLPYLRR